MDCSNLDKILKFISSKTSKKKSDKYDEDNVESGTNISNQICN